jgi:hypothetical protein
MKRRSGLADSPFFAPAPRTEPERSTAVFSSDRNQAPLNLNSPQNESTQASLQANNIASKQASLLAKMRDLGRLKATNAATFRFPPDLLEKLEEIEYRLRKDHKIKATKNIIVVGALAMLLCEFEENATESSLYQFLSQE